MRTCLKRKPDTIGEGLVSSLSLQTGLGARLPEGLVEARHPHRQLRSASSRRCRTAATTACKRIPKCDCGRAQQALEQS
jgi:hypothetical protein